MTDTEKTLQAYFVTEGDYEIKTKHCKVTSYRKVYLFGIKGRNLIKHTKVDPEWYN